VAGEQPGVALWPRFPGCLRAKEEALAIGRTAVPHGPIVNVIPEIADIRVGLGAWKGPVRVVARSLAMITVAAFAILVLLPAALAAQATVPG
jgi:hypothetical protein